MDTTSFRVIELLEKLIAFQSYPTSNTNDQSRILDFILEYCETQKFAVKKVNDKLGWAQIGSEGPLIGFPVHLDVVPPGKGWDRDPFLLTEDDEHYYGRGIYDNKGPTAMIVELVRELRERVILEKVRIRIIFGTEEETGMECIQSYVSLEEMPQYGFVPDALFPVVLGEKGRLHVLLSKNEDSNWIKSIFSGEQVNSVPDYGILELINSNDREHFNLDLINSESNLKINSKGISAHGSKPLNGANAGFILLESIHEEHRSVAMNDILALNNSELNGEFLEINKVDELFGDTTINLGVLNYQDNTWNIELDIRFGMELEPKFIIKQLEKYFFNWTISIINNKPCHVVERTELIEELITNFTKYYPLEKKSPIYMGGGTYASYFPGFISYGPKLESVRTFAHGKNERMRKSVFLNTIQIYRGSLEILLRFSKKN